MNVSASAFLRRISCLLILVLLALVGTIPVIADPAADPALVKSAMNSAQNWLAEIDAGKYEQSYAEGCVAFHNKVTKDQWNIVLKALRPPLGAVLSRKVASYTYKPDGFEGLEGECIVIKYNTAFTKVPTDLELVVLKREDGQWRGAGYNAQPQGDIPEDVDSPPPAEAHTEVDQQPAH